MFEMKKGILIYDTDGLKRNTWFAERLVEVAKEEGISLEVELLGEKMPRCDVDFAIVRVIAPSVSEYLEKNGVVCFNNFETSRFANDKYLTYQLSRELSIEMMETVLPHEKLEFPFVLKSKDGHGGSEVFLVRDGSELRNRVELIGEHRAIKQRLCDETGKDVRMYCLGGEVIASILRTSTTDFRSNFSLGGEVSVFEATEEMKSVARRLHSRLGWSLVGVDMIRNNGEWVLGEIEDVVGARMLYKCTETDIARVYIEYIKTKLMQF